MVVNRCGKISEGGCFYRTTVIVGGVRSRNKESARIKPHQKIMKIRSSCFYEPEGHSENERKMAMQCLKIYIGLWVRNYIFFVMFCSEIYCTNRDTKALKLFRKESHDEIDP